MDITPPAGTRGADPAYFIGTVFQDPIIGSPSAPARTMALKVHFMPGGRTHWHTHPLGQVLHVLSGIGRVQARGEPVREIRPGDTVWIPPGEEHWHGAAPGHAMTHLAMQEGEDGRFVTWLDPVSDAEYLADL